MRAAVIGTVSSSLVRFRGPLIQALLAEGHEVYAYAVDHTAESRATLEEWGAVPVDYRLDRTGTNPVRDTASVLALARSLRRCRVGVVFSYFIKPVVWGTVAAVMAGVPRRFAMLPGLGYSFRRPPGTPPGIATRALNGVVRGLLTPTLAANEAVFVYNDEDAAVIRGLPGVARGKVVRVPGTGVDPESYPCTPPVREPVTFVMAGRLLRQKGVREFAEAARRVRERLPDTRFLLLGAPDSSPDAVAGEDVDDWVKEGILEWPGRVADVRPWLEAASVYVLPSYYGEGVPRSIQEAMAMGRPIITTDWPGCRDTVVEGENGFLVPPALVSPLVERMLELARDPDSISEMGVKSAMMARECFDARVIAEDLVGRMALGEAGSRWANEGDLRVEESVGS